MFKKFLLFNNTTTNASSVLYEKDRFEIDRLYGSGLQRGVVLSIVSSIGWG